MGMAASGIPLLKLPDERSRLTRAEARRRIALDRSLLQTKLANGSEEAAAAPFSVEGGPLGDFCESLRDLAGHVLMWDEIALAVLSEAEHERWHWSLAPLWETPDAGQRLNRAGVAAARELPVPLLLQRFSVVTDALLGELDRYTDQQWAAPRLSGNGPTGSLGSLLQYVMT